MPQPLDPRAALAPKVDATKPSVLGFVADAKRRGLTPEQTAAEFKAQHGKDMWVAAREERGLPTAEPSRVPFKKDGHPEDWLPGAVVGSAGLAAGTLGGLATWLLPKGKDSAAAQQAFEASEAQRIAARGKSTPENFLADLGNSAAGMHVLGGRIANVEPVAGVDEPITEVTRERGVPVTTRRAPDVLERLGRIFKARAEQGEELGGGMVGGSASLLKGLATEPLQTVKAVPFTAAMSGFPAARGLRAAGRAAEAAGAAKPGVIGLASRAAGKIARATELPEAMRAAGNYVRSRAARSPAVSDVVRAIEEDIARTADDARVARENARYSIDRWTEAQLDLQTARGLLDEARDDVASARAALVDLERYPPRDPRKSFADARRLAAMSDDGDAALNHARRSLDRALEQGTDAETAAAREAVRVARERAAEVRAQVSEAIAERKAAVASKAQTVPEANRAESLAGRMESRGQSAMGKMQPTSTAYRLGQWLTRNATPVQQGIAALERAGMGAMMLGDFVGAPAGAAIGAAGPPGVRAFLRAVVPPERRAGFERWASDYTAQATPEASEQVRAATTGVQDYESGIAGLVDEYAGTVREHGLQTRPGGMKANVPEGRVVEHEIGDTGELLAKPEAVQTLAQQVPDVAQAAERRGALGVAVRSKVPGAKEALEVEKLAQRGTPKNEQQARQAAGLEAVVPTRKIDVEPAHPRQRAIAEQLHREVNHLAPEGEGFPIEEVMRWVTDVSRKDSIARLRDPGLRGRVASDIARANRLPPAMQDKLKLDLENQIVKATETALGEDYADIGITLPSGRRVTIAKVADEIFNGLPASERNEIQQTALNQMAQHLSEQAGKRRQKFVVNAELRRFESPFGAGTAAEWLTNVLQRVAKGEPPPLLVDLDKVMAGGEGLGAASGKELRSMPSRSLAGLLRSNPDAWAQQTGVPRQLVEQMAEHLEQFEPVTPKAMEARHGLELPRGTHAHHGYNSSVSTYFDIVDMARQATDIARLGRFATRNLTARNVPTHVTNASENLFAQSLRDGTDPVTTAVGWRNTNAKWQKFRDGKPMDPMDEQAIRGTLATGALRSGGIDELLRRGVGTPARGRVVAGAQKAGALLDEVYSLGDAIPKLDESIANWKWLRSNLDAMEPGSVVLRGRDGTAIRFDKTPEGRVRVNGRAPLELDHPEVGKALGDVAVGPALAALVDYRRMPKAIVQVKKAGPLAVASPFLTWGWKVLDLPGKPGILAATFGKGGFVLDSTSPTWWKATAQEYAGIAARRGALIQALNGQIHDRENAAGKLLASEPDEVHTAFVAASTHPLDVVATSDWSRGSWTGPFDRAMRLGLTAVSQATLAGREEALFPKEPPAGTKAHAAWSAKAEPNQAARRALFDLHARQGARWSDALELFGLDRPLLGNALRNLNKASVTGDDKAATAAALDIARMFLGGSVLGGADALIGAVAGPDQTGTTRKTSTRMPFGADPPAKHVFRALLGVGYRDAVMAGKLDEYLERSQLAITGSLDKAAGAEIEALQLRAMQDERNGFPDRAALARATAKQLLDTKVQQIGWLAEASKEILQRYHAANAAMKPGGRPPQ